MKFAFWHRRRRERELEEELQSHLAMCERDRLERGQDTNEARRAAHREFGNVDLIKEATRKALLLVAAGIIIGCRLR